MESQTACSPINILFADDDTLMHEMVMHALDDGVFKVTVVENGRQAVDYFTAAKWDLVLLDVDMPEMNGFAACLRIRQLDPDVSVPIVMITGLDDFVSIEAAYLSGADDFITKPITWPTLGQRLTYLHRGNQARLQLQAQMRSEQALYEAIPDSIVTFDSELQVRKLHKGMQEYLFADLDEKGIQHCTVVAMLTDVLALASTEQITASDFTKQITLDGQSYFLECRLAQREHYESILVIRDISQRKQDEEKIMTLIFFDPLTGLPNRTFLKEQLTRDIANCERWNRVLALLFLNVRAFSKINETFGIAVGDELILEISKRLAALLRNYDTQARVTVEEKTGLSRFAGDEFAIILRDVSDNKDINRIVERLIGEMAKPFTIQGHSLVVDLYIGCSLYPADAKDVGTLIAAADSAKKLSRQEPLIPFSFYDLSANKLAKRQHILESKLRHALENKEFSLLIQPKFHLSQPAVLSGELLLRWQNSELGAVSPAEFIPIAEQSGLIIEISEWVLEQGCRIARQLQQEYGLRVRLAINVSPQMFLAKENFLGYLTRLLLRYQIPAAQLELEITEYVLMQDESETVNTLLALQEQGVGIALDDFGTGYSSLSYLTRLDLNTLKIDRVFISTLDSERSQKLVKSIIALAKQLGMEVVAEGVETQAQLQFLQEMECDYAQGFLLAKPMVISQYVDFIGQNFPDKLPAFT
ncbi:putative bifunctional diguanylate cyclase/phosphodiesterase [Thalassomonas haliotis]|uniref:EAL domain-containing protein n=1 Tax=Thalassomonas haliotis TaxID=485448 RepID=A0ABY7VG52_9GAMM|nr:EAL domain-containing protein [Thalassomonas haliotis]WDE12709.1 EAL domain-containing protein [Thalassomonas haliotis]